MDKALRFLRPDIAHRVKTTLNCYPAYPPPDHITLNPPRQLLEPEEEFLDPSLKK
jgi:hypothetical protein